MPFALRNRLTSAQLVEPLDQRPIIWRPHGDPAGEDIQVVPDALRDDIRLNKAVKMGNLEWLEGDDVIDAAYDRQRAYGEQTAIAAAETLTSHIQVQDTANTMVGVPCIESGSRPGVKCDLQVVMPIADQHRRPPLCVNHQHLGNQYVLVDGGDQPDHWVKVKR
jgi:hypothetical protein